MEFSGIRRDGDSCNVAGLENKKRNTKNPRGTTTGRRSFDLAADLPPSAADGRRAPAGAALRLRHDRRYETDQLDTDPRTDSDQTCQTPFSRPLPAVAFGF